MLCLRGEALRVIRRRMEGNARVICFMTFLLEHGADGPTSRADAFDGMHRFLCIDNIMWNRFSEWENMCGFFFRATARAAALRLVVDAGILQAVKRETGHPQSLYLFLSALSPCSKQLRPEYVEFQALA